MHIFRKGQRVDWDPEKVCSVTLAAFGPGPFVVASTEEVPDNCGCGKPMEDTEHRQYGQCPNNFAGRNMQPLRKTVGHSQWLRLRPEGSTVELTGQFSGELLNPI
ncbi:MAG: hypothetical protein QOE22_606 [Candidatus Parcubacteria bacterium]|jgi:hypothetical protein|nr:hypothetical protein [Candidatus Parcubacteria bacterium]